MFGDDYSNAGIYFRHAQQIFTERFDKRGLAYVLNNITELSVKVSRKLEAETLFRESLSMKKLMGGSARSLLYPSGTGRTISASGQAGRR